ncbi:hypothetical protein MGA5115_03006 [Marinomonas gallaica]|uniref:Transposase IS200-like domain-containing protein n=1 Tax=Marinomonas gallaica TaxID=1806667 RepID=A0A1C3JUR2_9GAMM|nr:hypothetical protein MGA5115_03006 [Marinomonas gallaica]SBT21800.1 hypothetical protein MGA5116_02410 [Marinomonas gallaica]
MDISWFMKELNENIARQANFEDQCTGRFWEGRFKSQALLDEAALMACMAYVDLNPVRAKMTDTPEHSDHTSIKKRIHSAKQNQQPKALHPFVGNPRKNQPKGLPFKLKDYLQLVDLTGRIVGRIVRQNKRGSIDLSFTPILQRLNIPSENWLTIATQFEQHTFVAVGTETILSNYYKTPAINEGPRSPKRNSHWPN